MEEKRFVPALGLHALTPLYDLVVRLGTPERAFRGALVEQAGIRPGHRVLDVGCGTGTLAVAVKAAHPAAEVTGVDLDERVLDRAREKARRAGVEARFERASATALPYAADAFDRVLSSMMLHHLAREEKRAALAEALRVLTPGGELHVADWGRPHNARMWVAFTLARGFDGWSRMGDVAEGVLPRLLAEAGFVDVEEGRRFGTAYGTLALFRARREGGR
ncbi:MAG TPA: class I SAM-dependent methyltransferase [Longimicrobiaceae bacterium]